MQDASMFEDFKKTRLKKKLSRHC